MTAERLVEEAAYSVEMDHEIDAVVHTWKQFVTGDEFRAGANALLDRFREQDTGKLIVDTSQTRAHREDDQQWIQEDWTPRAVDAGMAYNAIVHNESVISEHEMERLAEEVGDMPYDLYRTTSMADAREWIAEQ